MYLVSSKDSNQVDGDALITAILNFIDKRTQEMTPLESEGLELLLSLATESLRSR